MVDHLLYATSDFSINLRMPVGGNTTVSLFLVELVILVPKFSEVAYEWDLARTLSALGSVSSLLRVSA